MNWVGIPASAMCVCVCVRIHTANRPILLSAPIGRRGGGGGWPVIAWALAQLSAAASRHVNTPATAIDKPPDDRCARL